MKRALIVLVVLFGIPLIALLYMYVRGAKVLVVSNEGAASIEVSEFVSDGSAIERTEKTALPAGQTTWLYFYPKLDGRLVLRCVGGGALADVSLGTKSTRLVFSRVRLDSCNRVISRSGFTF